MVHLEGEGVLLDLHADRYLALDGDGAQIWEQLARGVPVENICLQLARDPDERLDASVVRSYVATWRSFGLLADSGVDRASDGPIAKAPGAPGEGDLLPQQMGATALSGVALAQVAVAYGWAWIAVRSVGLAKAICSIQRIGAGHRDGLTEQDTVYRLARAERAFRAVYRRGIYDCLPRALAVSWLLARRGVCCDLCFGVQRFPFLAHAWVEWAGRIVTDPATSARTFKVIARF
jgi:hypothetical protein